MKPSSFDYHAPTDLNEAIILLSTLDDAQILSGGQSLVPAMSFRLAAPKHLIDINNILELQQLRTVDGWLIVGAGVRHAAMAKPPVAGPLGVLLPQIVAHIAHYTIRTRGTVCGSLAHADPASEWCLMSVVLEAVMIARSAAGSRQIAAREYFHGLMTTDLRPNEILSEIRIPVPPADAKFGFYEFSRRAGDYAIGMALASWLPDHGVMTQVRIGIGGIEGSPRRITDAEMILEGQAPTVAAFAAAAEAVASGVEPLEDLQADDAYRRDIARVAVRRALEASMQS
jgi:aerobic carbon-monoxide dehydrogenase medium subunit